MLLYAVIRAITKLGEKNTDNVCRSFRTKHYKFIGLFWWKASYVIGGEIFTEAAIKTSVSLNCLNLVSINHFSVLNLGLGLLLPLRFLLSIIFS